MENLLKQLIETQNAMLTELKELKSNQQETNKRLDRLETSQQQMQSDISGLKSDVNQLKADMTQGFENVDNKLDKLSNDMGHLISHEVGDAVDSRLSNLQFKVVK